MDSTRRESDSSTIIAVPAQIMNMSPRADRSWKIVFETRELNGSEVKILADNFQGEGWLVYKPNADSVNIEDIPQTDADAGIESPSIRLRKKLYILWKQRGQKTSFEAFYLNEMQRFMGYVDSKLEPEG